MFCTISNFVSLTAGLTPCQTFDVLNYISQHRHTQTHLYTYTHMHIHIHVHTQYPHFDKNESIFTILDEATSNAGLEKIKSVCTTGCV